MIIHLKLDNFKIWKSTGPMRLAPVTLLLGTNSSGKSSLIQSLLLIRQTVKSDEPSLDLNLGNPEGGDSVTLGQFNDVLCRHADEPRIGIEFRWSPTGEAADSTIFSAYYRRGPFGSAELDYLRLGREGQGFSVQRRKAGIYRLQLADERSSRGQGSDFRPQRSFAFAPGAVSRLGEAGERIKHIGPQLLDELNRIIYVGPIRRLAQRDYMWGGQMPSNLGDDGGKAVEALIASGLAAQRPKRRSKTLSSETHLLGESARWLKEMDLADNLSVKSVGLSGRHEVLAGRDGELVNLKDVGVGVSQVLPVIVAAHYASEGHIVIVEEPESHLHPLAEAILANLFEEVARTKGVQFIVETHSEHLFRRMQTLIAKQELSPSDCAMYFVEREGPGAKLRELEPDRTGRIKNWPDRFFGDVLGETREQTRLAFELLKRQK